VNLLVLRRRLEPLALQLDDDGPSRDVDVFIERPPQP